MSKTTTFDDPATELEAIKADLAALRGDVSSLSKSLLDSGVRKARAARKAVEHEITEATESVENFVQDRPFTTLAIAFGAGALAAVLLRRR